MSVGSPGIGCLIWALSHSVHISFSQMMNQYLKFPYSNNMIHVQRHVLQLFKEMVTINSVVEEYTEKTGVNILKKSKLCEKAFLLVRPGRIYIQSTLLRFQAGFWRSRAVLIFEILVQIWGTKGQVLASSTGLELCWMACS